MRNVVRAFWSVLVLVVVLSPFAFPQTAFPAPTRIMPLGDSITHGAYSLADTPPRELITGYRQPLYLALQDAGYAIDFVGGLESGQLALPAFDPDHEGHGGWRDDEVAAKVYSWLTANPADIVLLHIGTNSVDPYPGDVEKILNEIDRFSTETVVLLARIINRMTYSPETTAFNDNVEAMARQRIAEGDRIVIVDQESVLDDPSYYSDEKHPNASGYEKMAGVWYQALTGVLELRDSPPQITSTPVTHARTGSYYTYSVVATGYPVPSFSLARAPAGMTIDAASGVIQWAPDSPGSYTVSVEASNYLGTATQTFQLEVVETEACPAGLVSYWPLDETAGAPYVDIFNGREALCAGGGCPDPVGGLVLGAQSFGAGTGISSAPDTSFDWGDNSGFSIEFWMRRSGEPGGTEVIVGRNATESKLQWWVGIDHSRGDVARFFLRDRTGLGTGVSGSTLLPDGGWHHVAAVRDASASLLRIYVDGVEENSGATSYAGGFDSATATVDFGWLNQSSGYHYRGLADEVAFYDRALTAEEILTHYNGGLLGQGYCDVPPAPVAPSFVSDPPLAAELGSAYSYDADAGGIPAPAYSLDVAPSGMTIDPETGLIQWIAATAGSFEVVVRAANTAGEATQSFTLQVSATVLAPRITSSPPLTVTLGDSYIYDADAEGAPSPTFALLTAPSGMDIDQVSGLIEWFPAAAGSYEVTIEAMNSAGEDRQSFTVAVNEFQSGGCPEGLISYWRLDETSGPLYADAAGGKNGQCSEGGCPTTAAGQVQGGQIFGPDTGIAVAPDAVFDWGAAESFTIEFWMRRSGIPSGTEVIVGRDAAESKLHWWVGIDHSRGDVARFYLRDTSGRGAGVSSAAILADGAWHHVAAVRDAAAGRLRIYVDGEEEGSAATSFGSGFGSATAPLSIGWLNRSGGYHYLGLADEVAVHARALSPTEIREHYSAGLSGRGYCEAASTEIAPSITSVPPLMATQDAHYTYDVEASGVPAPVYSLSTAPGGMTIDSASGLIAWTPLSTGSFDVVVKALNSAGSDSQTFTVTVSEASSCPTGLLSYWTLDETSGPVYADILSGRDGQCAGGGCPAAVTGLVRGGQSFGAATGIAVPADAAFDWGAAESFSIEFWMRRTSVPFLTEVIVGREGGGTKLQWWVGIDHARGDVARIYLRNAAGQSAGISGGTFVADGGWHHIAAVRDGGAGLLRIYVDGVEEGSTAASFGSGFESLTAPLTIGWLDRSDGYHYLGVVDEAAIYDRVLTPGEIQEHFNDGLVGRGYCGE